jgi:hypothetical protein
VKKMLEIPKEGRGQIIDSGLKFVARRKTPRVGIHRANLADFILDLRNCYSQLRLYPPM